MTDREAFRFGFLARCADEGLSPEQTRDRIKLAAWDNPADYIPGGGVAKTLGGAAIGLGGLGLAASAGLGAGGGYLAAKATEPQMDSEDARMQELIAAYKQQADQARRTAARIGYRMQNLRPRGRKAFSPIAA